MIPTPVALALVVSALAICWAILLTPDPPCSKAYESAAICAAIALAAWAALGLYYFARPAL